MARYKPRLKMPSSHHSDDEEFLDKQFSMLDSNHQFTARVKYSEAFNEEASKEPVAHKKLNRARRSANIRLRKFVAACVKKYQEDATKMQTQQIKNNFKGF